MKSVWHPTSIAVKEALAGRLFVSPTVPYVTQNNRAKMADAARPPRVSDLLIEPLVPGCVKDRPVTESFLALDLSSSPIDHAARSSL